MEILLLCKFKSHCAVWQIFTNVLEEPTASIFYPEDGGSRFL
jgi:hypothetical protein